MNETETKFNKSFLHFQPNALHLMDINDKAAYNYHKCLKIQTKYFVPCSQYFERVLRSLGMQFKESIANLLNTVTTYFKGEPQKTSGVSHVASGWELRGPRRAPPLIGAVGVVACPHWVSVQGQIGLWGKKQRQHYKEREEFYFLYSISTFSKARHCSFSPAASGRPLETRVVAKGQAASYAKYSCVPTVQVPPRGQPCPSSTVVRTHRKRCIPQGSPANKWKCLLWLFFLFFIFMSVCV